MNDIEQKALEMISAARKEHPTPDNYLIARTALCRAIEQHEAFRQEVSDVVTSLCNTLLMGSDHSRMRDMLSHRFIIPAPKPDPLVEVLNEAAKKASISPEDFAEKVRAELDAVGLEIREKNDVE